MKDVDLHAAASGWFGRARLVEEFDVAPWHVVLCEAAPEDRASVIGEYVCEIVRDHKFCGFISLGNTRTVALSGLVFGRRNEYPVRRERFEGGAAEFKALLVEELTRIAQIDMGDSPG